jgi:hypothetical protein
LEFSRQNETTDLWDLFDDPPDPIDISGTYIDSCLRALKVLTFGFVFGAILILTVISKISMLLMTSMIQGEKRVPFCDKKRKLKK